LSGQPLLCHFIDLVKNIPTRESTDPKYFLSKKINTFSHSVECKAKQALIFTRNIDPEADSVGAELLRRGISYVRLNIEDIPPQHSGKIFISEELSCENRVENTR
jgi:hypothetical protein